MKVLGIAGSLREESYNRKLLNAAVQITPEELDIEIFELDKIPLYNFDVESNGFPESVIAFKEKIEESDGLLICTPEYNHSVPGVLKNALDWASRPAENNSLHDMPIAIMGSSPGIAGSLRAQLHLREILYFSNVMREPEIIVSGVHKKFDKDGNLTDEILEKYLRRFLESFSQWVSYSTDKKAVA